jgi:hypothetical protein
MSTPDPQKTRSLFPNDGDRGLTYPSRSGSLVVDRVAREADSDPQQNPATLLPQAERPGPSPLEPGPPEAPLTLTLLFAYSYSPVTLRLLLFIFTNRLDA